MHKDRARPVDLAQLSLQLSIAHTQVAQVLVRQVVGGLGLDDSLVNLTHLPATAATPPQERVHQVLGGHPTLLACCKGGLTYLIHFLVATPAQIG